jgi:hypothetical protein
MTIDDFSLLFVFCFKHLPAAILAPFSVFLLLIRDVL